jgi:quinol monooxygenase YgiN
MVCLIVNLVIVSGREEEAADMLKSYVKLVHAEPGCVRFDVHRSRKDPRRFVLYELYKDDYALDIHRKTEHFLSYAPKFEDLVEEREAELYNYVA